MTNQLYNLRDRYGDKYLRCDECGNHIQVSEIIEEIGKEEYDTLFTPEKINDLAFARCRECGVLRIHDLVDEKDNTEPEDQSDGQSKSQNDASEATESTDSQKPFSV